MQPNPYPNDPGNVQPGSYPNEPGYGQRGPYPNDPNYGQPGSYPNEPAYEQPTEVNAYVPPNQPGGQNMPPPYQQAVRDQEKSHTAKYAIAKVIDYITWLFLVLEAFALLRFFLKLVGADPANPFAQFLYNFTGFFLYPFEGIVPSGKFGTNVVHIFEWSTLIAMLVYGILFWIVRYFLLTVITRPEAPV